MAAASAAAAAASVAVTAVAAQIVAGHPEPPSEASYARHIPSRRCGTSCRSSSAAVAFGPLAPACRRCVAQALACTVIGA